VENISTELGEREWAVVDWFGLNVDKDAYDYGQVRSSCECGNEPSGSIKYWKTIE
jgi:hypothetical protein